MNLKRHIRTYRSEDATWAATTVRLKNEVLMAVSHRTRSAFSADIDMAVDAVEDTVLRRVRDRYRESDVLSTEAVSYWRRLWTKSALNRLISVHRSRGRPVLVGLDVAGSSVLAVVNSSLPDLRKVAASNSSNDKLDFSDPRAQNRSVSYILYQRLQTKHPGLDPATVAADVAYRMETLSATADKITLNAFERGVLLGFWAGIPPSRIAELSLPSTIYDTNEVAASVFFRLLSTYRASTLLCLLGGLAAQGQIPDPCADAGEATRLMNQWIIGTKSLSDRATRLGGWSSGEDAILIVSRVVTPLDLRDNADQRLSFWLRPTSIAVIATHLGRTVAATHKRWQRLRRVHKWIGKVETDHES